MTCDLWNLVRRCDHTAYHSVLIYVRPRSIKYCTRTRPSLTSPGEERPMKRDKECEKNGEGEGGGGGDHGSVKGISEDEGLGF